jgi:hypothetical protein
MAQVRVVRKGVTAAEVATVLSRRLGGGFEVAVFRVRGVGMPLVANFGTARLVADALRRSPEFRSV